MAHNHKMAEWKNFGTPDEVREFPKLFASRVFKFVCQIFTCPKLRKDTVGNDMNWLW
jgi:hypothetical protein